MENKQEENIIINPEKPKKSLSKAQLDNLAKMREKKKIKKEVTEIIGKIPIQQNIPTSSVSHNTHNDNKNIEEILNNLSKKFDNFDTYVKKIDNIDVYINEKKDKKIKKQIIREQLLKEKEERIKEQDYIINEDKKYSLINSIIRKNL